MDLEGVQGIFSQLRAGRCKLYRWTSTLLDSPIPLYLYWPSDQKGGFPQGFAPKLPPWFTIWEFNPLEGEVQALRHEEEVASFRKQIEGYKDRLLQAKLSYANTLSEVGLPFFLSRNKFIAVFIYTWEGSIHFKGNFVVVDRRLTVKDWVSLFSKWKFITFLKANVKEVEHHNSNQSCGSLHRAPDSEQHPGTWISFFLVWADLLLFFEVQDFFSC